MRRAVITVTVLATLLGGCSTTTPANRAVLAPDLTLALPTQSPFGRPANVMQSIVARYKDQSFAFDAQIEITQNAFHLVALDALGRRAFTIRWSDRGVAYDTAPWLPALVRPANVLADIAIVYAPEDALKAFLGSDSATLVTTENARKVAAHGRDLVTVDYGAGDGWSRAATLHNLALGYEIDIRSAELEQR